MKRFGLGNIASLKPHINSGVLQNAAGFTIVEILVSLFVVTSLLVSASTVVSTASSVNARTNLRADASEVAFQKLQDYINTDYNNLPIGDVASSYEVEDFSNDSKVAKLNNPVAKVYVEPASVVDTTTETTTTNYSDSADADTATTTGSEITATGTVDPTSCCRRDSRLRNNNNFDLYYNNFDPGSSNQELGGIDLGSSQTVSTIRINWYACYYTSANFRIEGSNNGSSWTTVASGLSTTTSVGCSTGNYPEDYSVSGGTYRYWRMFNVTGTHSTWIAISEVEAFSAASGDVVEEDNGGNLDFTNSSIDIGQDSGGSDQTVGIRFKDVDVAQGTTIDNAYIQFEAAANSTGVASFDIQGVDTDSAGGWSGTSAVTNAIAGANGTTANPTWSPGAWTASETGAAQQATVTTIVQELLNRGGWANGNDMAFAFSPNSGRRTATKSPAPQLVIEWSETVTTTTTGTYVDLDMDGDADNPTLLKVTIDLSYDVFGETQNVQYVQFIRQYGIGS